MKEAIFEFESEMIFSKGESVKQTPIQEQIERTVTNGEGFMAPRFYESDITMTPTELRVMLLKKNKRFSEIRPFLESEGYQFVTNYNPHSPTSLNWFRKAHIGSERIITSAISRAGERLPYLNALYVKKEAASVVA